MLGLSAQLAVCVDSLEDSSDKRLEVETQKLVCDGVCEGVFD